MLQGAAATDFAPADGNVREGAVQLSLAGGGQDGACPSELSRRDYATLAAYVRSQTPDAVECHRLLARFLAGSPIASLALARFPVQMMQLCIAALRSDTDPMCELTGDCPPSADPWSPRSWPFKVFLLGRFQVLKDDAPIRPSRRQQRKPLELLQALIAFGGSEISASRLTDALWPDSEGDSAYHALESALYRLRQLLGAPGVVTMVGGKLTLDRQQLWVDVWAFERELRSHASENRSAPEGLARMRELYAGHFLAHESEKPWAVEKRQLLRQRFVRAIADFAGRYENRSLWQEAARTYQIGIEIDGAVEEFHRGLILCYRQLGDRGAAIQAYRRCSEFLLKTLGVQPSAKTLALYQSVRHCPEALIRATSA